MTSGMSGEVTPLPQARASDYRAVYRATTCSKFGYFQLSGLYSINVPYMTKLFSRFGILGLFLSNPTASPVPAHSSGLPDTR